MKNKNRIAGFYWVKRKTYNWEIARYDFAHNCWFIPSSITSYLDEDFEIIYPYKLVPPQKDI